jgi:hypothetical protein
MVYTSDDLVSAINRNALVVKSQIKFTITDLLAFLNEELQLTIVGELMAMRQDYFVTYQDTALVANQSVYDLPSRAVGWRLDAVNFKDADGSIVPLTILTRDQRTSFTGMTISDSPVAVFFLDDKVHVLPDVGSAVSGYLNFEYVRIQNQLVQNAECGLVTGAVLNGANYDITVASHSFATGQYMDVIGGTNPFQILARNLVSTVAGNVISIASSTFERIPVSGDWVALTGKTPVPNIPEDYHAILSQAASRRCVGGDMKAFAASTAILDSMMSRLKERATKRVGDSPRKLVGKDYVLNSMRRRVY